MPTLKIVWNLSFCKPKSSTIQLRIGCLQRRRWVMQRKCAAGHGPPSTCLNHRLPVSFLTVTGASACMERSLQALFDYSKAEIFESSFRKERQSPNQFSHPGIYTKNPLTRTCYCQERSSRLSHGIHGLNLLWDNRPHFLQFVQGSKTPWRAIQWLTSMNAGDK